jgi:hypothetical protein
VSDSTEHPEINVVITAKGSARWLSFIVMGCVGKSFCKDTNKKMITGKNVSLHLRRIMKMRHKELFLWLLTHVLSLSNLHAQYDFSHPMKPGQMLYYQILVNRNNVRVTHSKKEWPYYTDNKPIGELISRLQKMTIHPSCERLLDSTIFNGCPLLKEAQKPKCHLQVWSFWCAQTIRE